MKKKTIAVFLAAMISAQPYGMVYAEDFSADVSVESSEAEEQNSEFSDAGEELPEEVNPIISAEDVIEAENFEAETVNAASSSAIKSIQLEGQYKSVTYYTPVNFGFGEKNKYSIVPSPWLGKKLKITYENGKTESIGVYKPHRIYGRNSAYIVYSGSQSAPQAGSYDVHFELGGKEAVLKNGIQVKNMSQMPAIMGRGTKEMAVTGTTAYVGLKTTSATSYTIKGEPQTNAILLFLS